MGIDYVSWRRSGLVTAATRDASGRLARHLEVGLHDDAAPGDPATAGISIRFRSAADVAQLTDAAIRRRVPAPHSRDAETTKCTHVDFHDPDLPWRYTPEPASGDRLRPWLALVVGTADEVRVAGNTVSITPALLALPCHDLDQSWRWAHVHTRTDDPQVEWGLAAPDRFSRVLSLRPDLVPLTTYTAVLVPTFNDAGDRMWHTTGQLNNQGRPLRVLGSWSFTTGEGGDFETLAALLHTPPAGDLGRAVLTHRFGGVERGPLDVRGALQSLAAVQVPPPAGANLVARDAADAVRTDDPERLGPPAYGRPWVADPQHAPTAWVRQLNDDVRWRIHAGTGTWVGVRAQDELMAAAVAQAGALPAAAGLVGRAALGVLASGAAWRRALPADPVERLGVLAPLTTRMLATDGSDAVSVADAVTGPDRTLDRALFTAAGQRLLGRAARSARPGAAMSAPTPGQALHGANQPPDHEIPRSLLDLWEAWAPGGAGRAEHLADVLHHLRVEWRDQHVRLRLELPPHVRSEDPEGYDQKLDELASLLAAELPPLTDHVGGLADCDGIAEDAARRAGLATWPDLVALALATGRVANLVHGPVQDAILACILDCRDHPGWIRGRPTPCATRIAQLRLPAPPDAFPIGLPALAENLARAVDPRGEAAPVRARLAARVAGLDLTSLAPPGFPLGLDVPTWTLLRAHEPDWLLPGAGTLPQHTVTALRTNPAFIDAFLVGLNAQFLSEARWRGLQADRFGTPLRQFFGAVGIDGRPGPDIVPIGTWPEGSPLGDPSHRATTLADEPASTERLVVLFHTPLFRRYPATVVYLQRAIDDEDIQELVLAEGPQRLDRPPGTSPRAWLAADGQLAPSFRGTLSPELVFFVFDLPPGALDSLLLVLDEPPTDLRFRNDLGPAGSTAAQAADALEDSATRVAFSGAHLTAQGRQP